MQGLEAWPPCHGSGDRNAAAEVTAAIRDDGYIARRAQDAILGCPAGAAFQHAAMLVTQLIADHRPAPVRAPAPVQQPRDEAGQIMDASNAPGGLPCVRVGRRRVTCAANQAASHAQRINTIF